MKLYPPFKNVAVASLEHYLHELQESGVDGLVPEAVNSPEPVRTGARPSPSGPISEPAGAGQHEPLEKIRRHLGDCQRCGLSASRKTIVFGVGNPRARLLFVGEGPGADEDSQGEPFVGAAGKILNRIISAMGLARGEVYICNVVKCRPPGNRDPEPDEIAACSPFLLRQIRSVAPEVIVTLGKPASHTLLGTKEAITKLRGKFRDFNGIPLMPTYHPSYLLRRQKEGSTEAFWEVWDDMVQVLQILKLPVPDKSRRS